MLLLADIRGAQNSQPFRVGGHDSVFNSVVNHLYKMAGTVGSAVQITLLGGAVDLVATGSTRYVSDTWRQRRENRIEMLHDIVLATNHHAIASLQTPHAAARAHIHIVNALRGKFLGAADVVHIIRIAAVDQDVSRF